MVCRGSLSHFVFLDRASLIWLEQVLHIASQSGWKLPVPCEFSSVKRTLKLSSFFLRNSPVLKISELCANDKSFFVLVPADSSSSSWLRLLQSTRNWIASLGILPPPPAFSVPGSPLSPTKTYAQVVGSSWSVQGRCEISQIGVSPGVLVKEDGIADRRAYLDRCLVFRFHTSDSIDWPSFRRWAHRNWGSPLEAEFQRLGDGLWLLFCGSSDKVNRIIALDRWLFGKIVIQLDRWIPEAGRSGVLLSKDVVWATIRGIPLHLRSSDLFRQLGDVCGRFQSFEKGDSLSSVRICFTLKGGIPEEIPIFHGGFIFPVKVELDSSPPSKVCSFPVGAAPVWNPKLKSSAFSPSVSPLLAAPQSCASVDPLGASSSSAAKVFIPSSAPLNRTVDVPRRSFSLAAEHAVPSTDVVFPSREVFSVPKVSETSSFYPTDLCQAPASSDLSPLSPRSKSCFVGFRLDRDEGIYLSFSSVSSQSNISLLCSGPLRLWGRDLNLSFGPVSPPHHKIGMDFLPRPLPLPQIPLSASPELCSTPYSFESSFLDMYPFPSLEPTPFPSLEPTPSHVSSSSTFDSAPLCFISQTSSPLSEPVTPASSSFSLSSSCSPILSEDSLLKSSVMEVAKAIGLVFEGSSLAGVAAAVSTCEEVIGRHSISRSRPSPKLELRRIDAGADSIISGPRKTRRERCVPSHLTDYEF
ncbi:hypothetical protein LINPERHAP1_LOCUS7119 [Linum perenne]